MRSKKNVNPICCIEYMAWYFYTKLKNDPVYPLANKNWNMTSCGIFTKYHLTLLPPQLGSRVIENSGKWCLSTYRAIPSVFLSYLAKQYYRLFQLPEENIKIEKRCLDSFSRFIWLLKNGEKMSDILDIISRLK